MASIEDIREARKCLSRFKGRVGTRGSRIHYETMEVFTTYQRILENPPCAACINTKVRVLGMGRAEHVELRCSMGHNQFNLYDRVPFGEEPKCADFSPNHNNS